MTSIRWSNIAYNICFGLNCMLLFLAVFGTKMAVPSLLQVAGRMHPLTLHFPIVLLLLAGVWETMVGAKDNPLFRTTGNALLLTSALSAVIAALMGLFLSKEGGYDEATILWHQWSGVAVSVVAWGWYAFRDVIRNARLGSRVAGLASLVGVIMAGHQGATLTHGENYLFAPVATTSEKSKVLLEDARVFEDVVRPILKEKCMNCHNTAKSKGDLVMETEASLLKGGKNGKLWDASAPQFGLLLQRAHLPADDEKHMPPTGKPQLTDQELKIIYYWIKSGSSFTQKLIDLPEGDTLRMLSADLFKTVEDDHYTFSAPDENTVKKLNNEYRAVFPLALNSPALGVEFFGIGAFKSEYIKELSPVKEQIVSLSLNRMPVKDEDLKSIADFTNLRKLNLSFTQITGATLGELKSLKLLRKLSLSGTGVKAADLAVLRELPDLSALYLWNTGVNDQDFAALKTALPKVHIEAGFKSDTVVAKLNAAIIEGDEQLFTTFTKVKLKNYINGASVRYTLDGSVPDSLTSPESKGDSIIIDKPCVLTTKTFLPGWISSDVSTRSFYKVGFTPDSVMLAIPPNPQYKGDGAWALANKKIGDTDFRSNKWLGFKDEHLESYMFFNKPVELSSVTLSTVVDIGSYIMPAQQVEVWGGTSKKNLVLLKKLNPEQPKGFGALPYRTGFNCSFPTQKISVLKIVARPVSKLPDWHPGKGTPGWVFVDEVFLN